MAHTDFMIVRRTVRHLERAAVRKAAHPHHSTSHHHHTTTVQTSHEPVFNGYAGVFFWAAVGILLLVVAPAVWWFDIGVALVGARSVSHKAQSKAVVPIYPHETRRAAVKPAVKPVRSTLTVELCQDCVYCAATGEPKTDKPVRRLKVMNAYDALCQHWTTWMEDESAGSMIADSVAPCGCCGTQARGFRIRYILS